jgi:hypothetical protein
MPQVQVQGSLSYGWGWDAVETGQTPRSLLQGLVLFSLTQ